MKFKFYLNLFVLLLTTSAMAQVPNGLNFDGVDDRIITNVAGVSGGAARTIEARIRTTVNSNPASAGGSGQRVIVDWGSFTTGGRSTFNLLWSNAIRFEVGGNGLSGTIPVTDGLWHHVAVVIDPTASNTVSLYVDGVLDAQGNLTVPTNSGTLNPIRIGRRVDNAGTFEGDMDEVRVWNVARTQAELQADMNSELCTLPSSLILYLPMNQGIAAGTNTSETTATDYSISNGTCTLTGFSLTGSTSNWMTATTLSPGFQIGGTQTSSACGIYTWPANSQSYVTSGMHQATVTATSGCDSIIFLDLTINPNTFTTENVAACGNYIWPANGQTYATAGQYFVTIQSAAGCDSNITLNLTISAPTSSTLDTSVCETFTWTANGQTYTTTTSDVATITNSSGCDSTITLNLTILSPSSGTQTESACGQYTWPVDGLTYIASGQYIGTTMNAQGCDSVVTLNLTINQIDLTVTMPNSTTLVSGEANAQYQWIDCATNQAVTGATNQTFNPTTNGSYAVVVTTSNCSDTSACEIISVIGLDELSKTNYSLYPNPTSNNAFISNDQSIVGSITLLDARGKAIQTLEPNGINTIEIDLSSLENGVYFVRVENETLRLVKQ